MTIDIPMCIQLQWCLVTQMTGLFSVVELNKPDLLIAQLYSKKHVSKHVSDQWESLNLVWGNATSQLVYST